MWPSASERRGQGGFSLLEIIVAVVVSGILLWSVTRFYKDSYRTYNLQEQLADRDQNAHFTIKHLTEMMQQTGSGLPDTGYAVLTLIGSSPYTSVILGTNPRGGAQFISTVATGVTKIPVGDTTSFKRATHVLVDYIKTPTTDLPTAKLPISSMVAGLAANNEDTIVVPSAVTLAIGDMVYAYKEDTIALSGTDLTVGGMVLAENIDNLKFWFYKTDNTPATTWATMRSAKIEVSARTPRADVHVTSGDPWRHLSLVMTVLFRNRI